MQHLPISLQEKLIDSREGGNLTDESQEESLHS